MTERVGGAGPGPRVALTVAGLDPSGGAGIIADVRTFDAMGVYGMAVASCLTFQSTRGLSGMYGLSGEIIRKQLDALLADRKPDAAKTGALGSRDVVIEFARIFRERSIRRLVVDPVLASSDGVPLLGEGGLEALTKHLFPLAAVVTPNQEEASRLCEFSICDVDDMKAAALYMARMGTRAVLITGGKFEQKGKQMAFDVLYDGHDFKVWTSPWIEGRRVHGTGCVLSAAITASLAMGMDLLNSVVRGRNVVRAAIECPISHGTGDPCAAPWWGARRESYRFKGLRKG